MSPLPNFDVLFKDDNYWQSGDGKTFRVSALRDIYECSADVLNTLHPFLAECVFQRIRYNGRVDMHHYTTGEEIKVTLAYLINHGLQFNDETGSAVHLGAIVRLNEAMFTKHKVSITGPAIKVEITEQNGCEYPIVRGAGWYTNLVYRKDLEARYPGWETRWNIAKDIGFDGDLITHVFSPETPLVKPSLDGVDFDTDVRHE